jgi:hypothetical protein
VGGHPHRIEHRLPDPEIDQRVVPGLDLETRLQTHRNDRTRHNQKNREICHPGTKQAQGAENWTFGEEINEI